MSDEHSVAAAATAALARLGTVDILINNAGITGPNKTTWDYAPDEWRTVIAVDLTGAFLCARALVPHMMARKYGRIVNIASVAGKEGNPNAPAYSAAKAGLIALTKSLGKELAASGVAVNCVTPAAARTELFDQMTPAHIDYMLREDSDGPLRRDARDRGARRLARVGGLQLQHRRRLRHLGRARDLLRRAGAVRPPPCRPPSCAI